VQQVLTGYALGGGTRAALDVTIYFSEVDHAGHDYGPETSRARLDDGGRPRSRGGCGAWRSSKKESTLQLKDRTSFVIVSDQACRSSAKPNHYRTTTSIWSTVDNVIEWTPNLGV